MPRRAIPLISEQYYPIYNRGHNRSRIFLSAENYKFFLKKLREHLVEDGHAVILAYVLLPTHYHLLLKALSPGVSHAMQNFSISYTKAMNKANDRVGSIFQGPFQSKWVDRDAYLVHLSRYIHLNPIEAKLVDHLEDWSFSSYMEYVGLRNGTLPQTETILTLFSSDRGEASKLYRQFVMDGIDQTDPMVTHLLFRS